MPESLAELTPALIYLVLGAGAAVENLIPPVPADTFVVLGGFFAAQGRLNLAGVFLVTWGANVASALGVYAAARKYGPGFFERGLGRHLLERRQIETIARFYGRWGHWAIFLTRFLPGLRAIVPVFAGITRQRFWPVALPLALASAIWYGVLTWFGGLAGRNVDAILEALGRVNAVLLLVAAVIVGAIGVWWVRTRRGGGA